MVDLAFTVAGSFIEVTVWVGAMIGGFAFLQHRLGHRVTAFLLRHWRAGPWLGALAGVIPGCGGAILVVPLFARSRVSFGTLVAALVATMGDASFVMIAANARLAGLVHAVLFTVGVACGIAVDVVGYSPRTRPQPVLDCGCVDLPATRERAHQLCTVAANGARHAMPATVADGPLAVAGGGRAERPASPPSLAMLPRVARLAQRLGVAVTGFWILVAVGITITVPVALRMFEPEAVPRPLPGVDPFLLIGTIGAALAYLVARRARQERLGRRPVPDGNGVAGVLREAAQESARVAVWIAVAFVAIEVATDLGLSIAGALSVAGLAGVLIGALLGLIPGCGPQIVLTGLYLGGTVPFATLIANALSQDGDALLPLLLLDRRSAVIASVLTTIPGLLGGVVVLTFGVSP